jgi:Fanconi anemia group M protein
MVEMQFIDHPLIKKNSMEARTYQQAIFGRAVQKNTMVVLPTGTGKTNIVIMVAAYRLTKLPDSKILMVAPTRPLVLQHCITFKRIMNLPGQDFQAITGHVPPENRRDVWSGARLIFATPQVVEHDLIGGLLSLENFSLLIMDEVHRATGRYPYPFIASQYMRTAKNPLILALTASPGADAGKIEQIKKNLFIENIEIRTEKDFDVRPYVQPIEIEWRRIELPQPFQDIKRLLGEQLKEHLSVLKKYGFVESPWATKRELLRVQQEIQTKMRENEPSPPQYLYECLIAQTAALRLTHAIELLETQGLDSLHRYLDRMIKRAKMPGSGRAIKLLANDVRTKQIFYVVERLGKQCEHPKLKEVLKIVRQRLSENEKSRIIIFAHYRDSVERLVSELNKFEFIRASKFIGQSSREGEEGMSQKEQAQILDKFKTGEFNVLVATSVGEEGIDIPSVELVIFYEAVPSEIRFIQRRGRTGRVKPGKVIVMLAKGTRDEAFYWSAVHKEKRMREFLKESEDEAPPVEQKVIDEFAREEKVVKVIADHREVPSGVVRELARLGVAVEARQLEVGDYVLSDRVGVERKNVSDFLQSIVDKRLLEQAKRLSQTFERPILILEGEGLYSQRAIHPNAVRGALAAIAVGMGVSIIPTVDEKDTAAVLSIIARREQIEESRKVAVRGEVKGLTLAEQQRFVVEGLPGVSAVLAERLLEHFGTVEKIMIASEKELQEVKGIGPEKAREIRRVLCSLYSP